MPRSRQLTLALCAAAFVGAAAAPADAATDPPPYGVTAAVTVSGSPTGIAVDPATHTAYVTQADANSLAVVDLATGTVATTVAVGTSPGAVAADPDAHRVYAASALDGSVTVVDTTTDAVVATPTFFGSPNSLAVDAANGTVLVAGSDGVLSVVDAATGAVTGSVTIGSEADRVVVDSVTGTAYVTDGADNTVVAVALHPLAVVRTVTDSSFQLPFAIAVDPSLGKVFVGNLLGEGDTVSVVDTTAGDSVSTIAVGGSPISIAVDPDDHRAFVGNQSDHSVSVIDTAGDTVLDTVGLPAAPQALAVDAGAHTSYVTTGSADSVVGVVAGGTPSPPPPRATSVAVTADDAVSGSPVTLTAAVTPKLATGTVSFTADDRTLTGCSAVPLTDGAATCTTTFTSYGTAHITASYGGSTSFAASSGDLQLAVANGDARFVGSTSGCSSAVGTIVAVDYGSFGGPITRGCDLQRPVRGIDLLHDTGYTASGTEHDGPAFLCRIGSSLFEQGRQYPTPATEKCVQTPPASAYWSYWIAQAGENTWSYSPYGAYSDTPVAGEVEAWTYGGTDIGGTTGLPAFSPKQVRATKATAVGLTRPAVSGTARVGAALTVTPRTTPGTAARFYRWLRNGVDIAHATRSTYVLTAADLHARISVRVAATQAGYVTTRAVSAATAAVTSGRFPARRITLQGKVKPGHTITAAVAASGVSHATAAYRWYRDGTPIAGATHRTYRVRAGDAGRLLSVHLRQTAPAYSSVTLISARVRVTR